MPEPTPERPTRNAEELSKLVGAGLSQDQLTANEQTQARTNIDAQKTLVWDSTPTADSSNPVTSSGIKLYVDNMISGHGSYLGQKTVAQINALPVASLNNGDHIGAIDSGNVNNPDGTTTTVVAGDNIIYDSTSGKWDRMIGDYKTKQDAKFDPTASGNAISFIDSITQNANGEITATKKNMQDSSTSQKGVVQLSSTSSSTEQSKAATPKLVYDSVNGKADKSNITGATKCKITYNGQGIITSGADLASTDIPNLDASKITSGQFADARIASATNWNTAYTNSHTHSNKSVLDNISALYTAAEVNSLWDSL